MSDRTFWRVIIALAVFNLVVLALVLALFLA